MKISFESLPFEHVSLDLDFQKKKKRFCIISDFLLNIIEVKVHTLEFLK